MKKGLWLLAICAVLVFAMSAVAYADTTSGYAPWSATGDNAAVPSPHNGYTLTTVKCAVCHAVHKATQAGEILLRDTAGNACVFCHITSNTGNVQVYGGVQGNYTSAYMNNHGSADAAPCVNCHAVHGAGAIDSSFADVDARILKANPGVAQQAGTPWDYSSAQRNGVISKFCTGCHPYYVGTYDDGVGTNGNHPGSFNVGTFGGHIMTSTVNAYGNVKKSAGTPAQVAFASDLYCRDCHDSGNTQEGAGVHANNFPHYTTGMRFEKAALSTVGGAGARVDATQSPVQDGVCLKCHSDGVNGVNKNF